MENRNYIEIDFINDFIQILSTSMKNLENKSKYAFKDYENKDLLIHEKIIDEFRDCMSLLNMKLGDHNYKQLTLIHNNPQDDIIKRIDQEEEQK